MGSSSLAHLQRSRASAAANRLSSHPAPTTKFRHIQGVVMHRDTHITNLRNLNLTTPGESDGFCVNRQRLAVPLSVSGGQIAVFEVRRCCFLIFLDQAWTFLSKPN